MTETLRKTQTVSLTHKRNLGVDALRILSMLMVVTLHVLGGEGLFLSYTHGVPNGVLWYFEAMAYPAVNCYAMITGYVCVTQKSHKYSRLIDLVCQAFFYSVIIQAVSEIFHYDGDSAKRIIDSFIPSDIGGYWYFVMYCGLFFIIPLLNKIIINTSRRTMWKIMIGSFIVFSAVPYLYQRDLFRTSGGFSMLWLAILYFFGAYLRLYGAPRYNFIKAISRFIICTTISWITVLSTSYLPQKIGDINLHGYTNGALSYTAPLMLLAAVFLMIAFMQYNPKQKAARGIIKALAPFTFGVYLLHLHPEIWEFSKVHLHRLILDVPQAAVVPVTVAVIFAVYLVCSFGDFIRFNLFKLFRIPKMCVGLEKWLRKLFGKLLDKVS